MNRTDKIRLIHARARAMRLRDDVYRDRLERATGKRSAAECTDEELERALRAFVPPRALHPHQAKLKALWIGLYNLGALEHGDDAALDRFVLRQTGRERLVFLGAVDAHAVAEALRAMAARHGWIVPSDDEGGMQARIALVRAQWSRLHALGVVRIDDEGALISWARGRGIIDATRAVSQWSRHELDLAAKRLGRWIRIRAADREEIR